MEKSTGITQHFGENLANILSDKILTVYPGFNKQAYVKNIAQHCQNFGYTQRVELHADQLYNFLPKDFNDSSKILISILGEENKKETGMFSEFYWMMPIGKYIEKYGLEYFDQSMLAIQEITKRNTGEYAIRAFIRKYPEQTLRKMTEWAQSDNFHLRRLASEGLRPKLPWATKLETFIHNPAPVFAILDLLKEDKVMFVKKSVANHLTDWLKVNKEPTVKLIKKWRTSNNIDTKWIIKRATRKISLED